METQTQTAVRTSIDARARVGFVHLTVNDLDNELSFYREALGLRLHWRDGRQAGLGAGGDDILRLTGDPQAPRPRRATGLYHFAVLLPGRQDLGRSLYRLAATQTPLQGAADHWFSEAIYLADPEGNGIEAYRDRPREQWPPLSEVARRGNGHFDLRLLLNEVEHPPQPGEMIAEGACLGHMHLRAASIPEMDQFYTGVLGFDLMMRFGGSAGFVSAGGYHHHIAYNTWESAGAPPAVPGAAGLREFSVVVPDEKALGVVLARVDQAGIPVQPTAAGALVRDPAGIGVVLSSA